MMTELPIEGGSGKRPSGALKFQNDWPGLFLRGDYCMFLASEIRQVLECVEESGLKVSTYKLRALETLINEEVLVDRKEES